MSWTVIVYPEMFGSLIMWENFHKWLKGSEYTTACYKVNTHQQSLDLDLSFRIKDLKEKQSIKRVDVSGQKPFPNIAVAFADHLTFIISQLELKLGITISYRPHILLIECDNVPASLNCELTSEGHTLPFPIFVSKQDPSVSHTFVSNIIHFHGIVHELIEVSIAGVNNSIPIANDYSIFFNLIKVRKYTRWFREGFSEYAEVLINEILQSTPHMFWSDIWRLAMRHNPLLSLHWTKQYIFYWHQFSKKEFVESFYNAALGIFLVFRHRFGDDAIHEIGRKISKESQLDGKRLLQLCSHVLGTDVRSLIEGFTFPQLGIRFASQFIENYQENDKIQLKVDSVQSQSIGDRAGIMASDIIVQVNDMPVCTSFEFEMALLESIESCSATMIINRQGQMLQRAITW